MEHRKKSLALLNPKDAGVNPDSIGHLEQEHRALVRCLAKLQVGTGEEIARLTRALATAQAQTLRLRAELIRMRTAVLWGMPGLAVTPTAPRSRHRMAAGGPDTTGKSAPVVEPMAREAQTVICRTGCAGHGHPWRDDKGHCLRSGDPCDAQGETAMPADKREMARVPDLPAR